jgi:predicted nucleic acid-binding protein
MYVLDTNVVSELRKVSSGKAHRGVTEWAASVPTSNLYLSVITILELEQGVLLVERRDRRQGAALRQWLDSRVMTAFAGRVLPVDTEVARQCARLHVPDPRSERDALIAATALVHGMTIVTRNEDDFAACSVPVLNPWLPR